MAAARRAVGTVATANNVSSIAPGVPAGNLANDIQLMVASVGGTVTVTMPAGWTQKISRANGTEHKLEVWWKRSVGGDTAPTVTFSGNTDAAGRIVSYSGCITTGDPVNAFDSQANASSATTTSPAITPLVANSMIVFLSAWSTTGASAPTCSGYSGANPAFTEAIDNVLSGTVHNCAVAAADGLSTSTASLGTRTATWTAADLNSAGMLALTPDVPAAAVTAWRPLNLANPGSRPGSRNFQAVPRGYPAASGTSAIQGAIVAGVEAAGTAAGAGVLSGASIATAVTAARVGGALPANGAAIAAAVAAGNLGGTAVTQGAVVGVAQAAGQLQGAGQVSGAVVATTFTAGSVQATATLTGAIVVGAYAAGTLADFVSGNLFGALVAGASASAQLAAAAAANGATIAVSFTSGQLSASAALNGASVVVAVVAGVLSGVSPGAMNAAAAIAVSVAGVLVSLTPAGPENVGGGLAGRLDHARHDADTRVMKFYDLQRPQVVPASNEASSEAAVSAFLRSESVKSSAVNSRQREALALLLLMV